MADSDSEKIVLVTGVGLAPPTVSEAIRNRGFRVRHLADDHLGRAELMDALRDVHGYLVGGYEEPVDEHFDGAHNLRVMAFVGTDYRPYIPGWRRARDRGVTIVNTPGANATSVAEFTFALALAMARPFTTRIAVPEQTPSHAHEPGLELCGRMLGIIGLGRIGAQVARIAKFGFRMDVAYHAPRRNFAAEAALGVRYHTKVDLLRHADLVTLHRPGPEPGDPPELGEPELGLLRDGAIVLNAGHVNLIDPVALLDACRDRGVRAAVDGVSAAGDPHQAAWQALIALGPERFLCVPAMAYNTREANLRAALQAAESVCDLLS